MKDKVDYIIIGQGIAGSLLAFQLMGRGKSVRIFDHQHTGASSQIAAGIINPITGRRFAKSWRIDEFLPFAKEYYQKLESLFGKKLFYDRSVIRFLHGNKDVNDWYARSSWEGFSKYMQEYKNMESLADWFHLPFDIGEIKPAAQVDLPLLIAEFKNYFLKHDLIDFRKVAYQELSSDNPGFKFDNIEADKIIFCEGHQARFNPLFQFIPFEPAKGEVLFLKIPGLNWEHLLKNKLMIAPLGEDVYWTGSNYEWNAPDDKPTNSFKEDFIIKLKKTLKLPFEILDHKAAIRPTIKDRRPVIGMHPKYSNIAIFNGLGTKGASLGPFWAKEMVDYLLDNKALNAEVDVHRFA